LCSDLIHALEYAAKGSWLGRAHSLSSPVIRPSRSSLWCHMCLSSSHSVSRIFFAFAPRVVQLHPPLLCLAPCQWLCVTSSPFAYLCTVKPRARTIWPWPRVDAEGVLELGARQPACVACTLQGVFLCCVSGTLRNRGKVVLALVARSGGSGVEAIDCSALCASRGHLGDWSC
jgi:hypothetical protein